MPRANLFPTAPVTANRTLRTHTRGGRRTSAPSRVLAAFVALGATSGSAAAADLSCNGLVPSGARLICSGFEPNWALVLSCSGTQMSSTFIDAFSGADLQETPGTVAFASQDPWQLSTSHGIEGSIAYTPAGCTDESDTVRDFTFTPSAVPGLSGPFFPFCCRLE